MKVLKRCNIPVYPDNQSGLTFPFHYDHKVVIIQKTGV